MEFKRTTRPDEAELKAKIAVEDEKIASLQTRLTAIKDTLDSRESSRGDGGAMAQAKSRLAEQKSEARRLQQEKRNIYDQISAADELRKQQQDLTQRLRSELSFFRRVRAIALRPRPSPAASLP